MTPRGEDGLTAPVLRRIPKGVYFRLSELRAAWLRGKYRQVFDSQEQTQFFEGLRRDYRRWCAELARRRRKEKDSK